MMPGVSRGVVGAFPGDVTLAFGNQRDKAVSRAGSPQPLGAPPRQVQLGRPRLRRPRTSPFAPRGTGSPGYGRPPEPGGGHAGPRAVFDSATSAPDAWGIVTGQRGRYEDGLYGAGPAELLARLRCLPDDVGSLMLVGHNPGLQELAVSLAGNGDPLPLARLRDKLPTGALVKLTFHGPWASLGQVDATLEAMVRPQDL